jgi:hypothetical protein
MALKVITGPVIPAGGSLSEAVDIGDNAEIVRINMPAEWTPATLAFAVSAEGTRYSGLYAPDGREVTINVVPGGAVVVPEEHSRSIRLLKLHSGAVGQPIEQEAERQFELVVKQDAAPGTNATGTMLDYSAKTTQTTAGDPGDTKIAWDTAAQDDATHLFVDARDIENRDLTLFWQGVKPGQSITIQKKLDATVIKRYAITANADMGGWFDLTVTPGQSSGPPLGGNDPVLIVVS